MKTIEVDEQIYRYIASRTLHIGESASDILRRLLALPLDTSMEPTVSAVLEQKTDGVLLQVDLLATLSRGALLHLHQDVFADVITVHFQLSPRLASSSS